MGNIKTAILRAQKQTITGMADEIMLWCAQEALTDAINNPEPDEGLVSAERALSLLNTYLRERELCKR